MFLTVNCRNCTRNLSWVVFWQNQSFGPQGRYMSNVFFFPLYSWQWFECMGFSISMLFFLPEKLFIFVTFLIHVIWTCTLCFGCRIYSIMMLIEHQSNGWDSRVLCLRMSGHQLMVGYNIWLSSSMFVYCCALVPYYYL